MAVNNFSFKHRRRCLDIFEYSGIFYLLDNCFWFCTYMVLWLFHFFCDSIIVLFINSFSYVCGDIFAKWWIEQYNISTFVCFFLWGIFRFVFQSKLIVTCYVINITISKNLCLLKLSNKVNVMRFFQFCSFVFNADFDTKHVQFLISKSFPNFCSKDIEVDSHTLFLRICR